MKIHYFKQSEPKILLTSLLKTYIVHQRDKFCTVVSLLRTLGVTLVAPYCTNFFKLLGMM